MSQKLDAAIAVIGAHSARQVGNLLYVHGLALATVDS
jgi:hypothetical protein